jgi:uncharacterized protein YoxC
MRIKIDLTKTQTEILIRLLDNLIDDINAGKKDTLRMGIDEYINLVHDLEGSLDEVYS